MGYDWLAGQRGSPVIGQLPGARRGCQRTLPRRPGKQLRRWLWAPAWPSRSLLLVPAPSHSPGPVGAPEARWATLRESPGLAPCAGGRAEPIPALALCLAANVTLCLLLSVELAVKGPGRPSGAVGSPVRAVGVGTIPPESWGRGPCPISRAPGATADLVREKLWLGWQCVYRQPRLCLQ